MEADSGKDATVISTFFMYKCFLEFDVHLFNFQGTEQVAVVKFTHFYCSFWRFVDLLSGHSQKFH